MAYKALTYVDIPPDNHKQPGDTITEKELKDANPVQGKEEIANLIKSGAIGKPDDKIDKAHTPVLVVDETATVNVVTSEVGSGGDTNA